MQARYDKLRRLRNKINLELIWLSDKINHSHIDLIFADFVMRSAAAYFDLDIELLKKGKRDRPIVDARHIAMKIIRENTGLSLNQIGVLFHVHHATVLNACHKVDNLYQSDKKFRAQYEALVMEVEC